jgi:ssDNA-binding Zn-finger/Zn-ribbon topoisomerase 1
MSVKGFHTHKQCANFKNGFCMAYGIAMNPDDPACPNFTPKTTEKTQRTPRTSPALYQSAVPPMQTAENFPQFPQISGRMNWYKMSGRGGGRRGRGGAGRGGGMGGRGRGRMGGGFAAGPGGGCTCPNCGYTAPHNVGTPCYQQICPRCGSRMTRKT